MTTQITPRQRKTAHSLVHEWAAKHRVVTMQTERDAFIAAHSNVSVIDPAYLAHIASVVDRLGGEYASRMIGRTVTSLHDLTTVEASQVIDSLLRWKRQQR